MRTTRLLTGSRGSNGLDGALEEVTEFERFNKVTSDGLLVLILLSDRYHVRVPNHAPVLDANLGEGVVDFLEVFNSLVQRLLGPVQGFPLALGRSKRLRVELT